MSDLTLSTKKSLHRPIVITVDGKNYTSKPIVKSLFDEIVKLQLKGEAGDVEAPYEQVKLVFGVPKKILYELDMRDLSMITALLTDTLLKSENYRTEQEKKDEGPGDISSVS